MKIFKTSSALSMSKIYKSDLMDLTTVVLLNACPTLRVLVT